jgi:hypothetical protein
MCVDVQDPLYSFVIIDGMVEIISNEPEELFKWAKIIAARYIDIDEAKEYDRINSSEEGLLIKIKPTKVIGQKDIAGW